MIAQRHEQGHLGGLWEFPGGKRESDETHEACLRRELREELGIEIGILGLIEIVEHDYPEKSVRLKFFRCALILHEPAPIGCQAVVWVTAAELANYAFPEADQKLIGKLRGSPGLWQ